MSDVHLDLLDRVDVASPCSARWEDMTGDERSRRCGECRLTVHNLSAMTRAQAEALLRPRAEGNAVRLCVRFYRRADGTILTNDCPMGLAALRARTGAAARKLAAGVAVVLSGALALGMQWRGQKSERLASMQPFAALRAWLNPGAPATPVFLGRMVMGDVCVPSPVSPAPAPDQGGVK